MSYILKNTSGLINTRLTDAGRQKLSQGSFNISYFQIGDSEVSYNALPATYNQTNTNILMPSFNAQNISGAPESNKQNIKYPYYVDGNDGNTYGIPFMSSVVSPVYNRPVMRGFFTGDTTASTITWSALTNNYYVINSNYIVNMSTLTGGTTIKLIYSGCNTDIVRLPTVGDIITIYYDGKGKNNCSCVYPIPPTPTPTISNTPTINASPTPTPTITNTNPCLSPTPTPSLSATFCPTPTPSRACPPPPPPNCLVPFDSCYSILTYKIVGICLDEYTLDRATPDFSMFSNLCYGRVLVYPPNMTSLYDSITPSRHWNDDVINFESVCYTDAFDVKIWNMNIPWSETPAGIFSNTHKTYSDFGSINYLGTKEYLGYASSSGQTDSSSVFYYNSFDERVTLNPKDQKAIAIIHYTNQTIDLFYGEKFALEPFDNTNPDAIGQARNFRIHIPWIMWHKNPNCCYGQTFWVDPPGFDGFNLFKVEYLESTKNSDMNVPGIRYYHLWDNNPNSDGYPNRVGKVFPDHQIVIIDDEEIIAAMTYKSNRNWTLPAPKLSLITPNVCNTDGESFIGILTGDTEYLYVTYRFTNTNNFTNSLHCNYYLKIQGPNLDCQPTTSQNVAVRFGPEFGCLNQPPFVPPITTTTTFNPLTTTTTFNPITTTTTFNPVTTTTTICPTFCDINSGFFADKFEIICQKVTGNVRPDPEDWKIIDFTNQLSATTIDGYITQNGLTGNTFIITQELYDNAQSYDLSDYIDITQLGFSGQQLNFGDEYYFYGSVETDIQATIYEMRYKINLSSVEFQSTSNPTWTSGTKSYITEIGLFDDNKDLMLISKLQSPVLRQGTQQFLVKFDF
jgi:hypothetical protein